MNNKIVRHVISGIISLFLVWIFWESRPLWDPEMRLWKAVGDAAFVLLITTLLIGPLVKLGNPLSFLLIWRKQLGIWFAFTAMVHSFLILKGWARWDISRFLGYEFIPELGRMVRLEPGFGLSNLLGAIALLWAVVLLITSMERVMKYLGASSWKWLHNGAYVIFYLAFLHAGYFLFMHYTLSFHKAVPEPDWFQYPFVALGASVPVLQVAAYLKIVYAKKNR